MRRRRTTSFTLKFAVVDADGSQKRSGRFEVSVTDAADVSSTASRTLPTDFFNTIGHLKTFVAAQRTQARDRDPGKRKVLQGHNRRRMSLDVGSVPKPAILRVHQQRDR
jgi:hypothetical protein